ncbi:DNA recombination protein RmuC [Sphaerotilus sulfidivorans]|uniref:DNA recombination protein RmuC n=1 Tax=Sphaerotilus sulfidivorans TaxID=639200 RepID=A0A5C1Q1H6_9BURK|nr:DNA recombination protein RmuC [Sphaerotilus sulfidivorans]NZD45358.1 DNA recombination protein RmuC [Sphaerotilus sulfidivorans]QEN00746.1 DNA recombination protein RmuC [Sphaerotilus sulfidivorans]
MSGLETALLALGLAQSGLLVWLLLRPAPPAAVDAQLEARLAERLQELSDAVIDAGHAHSERVERELRAEIQASARGLRQESNAQLVQLQRLLMTQSGEALRTQDEHLHRLAEASERRLQALQQMVEQQLDQMRATVDDRLQSTLETRLGESFRQVAERLEQVHRGLGEMQTLAQGVGDLRRVLGNVKTRGILGEVQLAALLEQVFTPQQFAVNVATVPGSRERVEFAIRLPGQGARAGEAPVWLPIDAKFPREDFERLLDAQDRADRDAAESAARALEARIRDEARTIAAKYLAPPHTTDFAVLFVPTEGLYAELLRRPGLFERLQREHHVTLAGPTTLLAMLGSLQMGFRTLALEQRSTEVWKILGGVKTEFARFGEVLEKTRRKLQEASSSIESAEVRTRAMARQLRSVEGLTDERPPGDRAED